MNQSGAVVESVGGGCEGVCVVSVWVVGVRECVGEGECVCTGGNDDILQGRRHMYMSHVSE